MAASITVYVTTNTSSECLLTIRQGHHCGGGLAYVTTPQDIASSDSKVVVCERKNTSCNIVHEVAITEHQVRHLQCA